jgi:YggT family protein
MMFIPANFVSALAQVLDLVLNIIFWLVALRALISWVNADPGNAIVRFLDKTTEPLLRPIRIRLPLFLRFGVDISPLVLCLFIMFLRAFLVKSLFDLAWWLRLRQ